MRFGEVEHVSWIKLEAYPDDGLFRTAIATQYAFKSGAHFTVPSGFVFDGASIPAVGFLFVRSAARAVRSLAFGLAHDYAYRIDATWSDGSQKLEFTRPRADRVAAAVAEWAGITASDAEEIRLALRLGAGPSWRRMPVAATREQWLSVAGNGF